MNNIENSTVIVGTNYGLVRGILTLSLLNDTFYSFHGIPYAKPPLGELRFKDPQIIQPWIGVKDATREPSQCLNRDSFTNEYVGSEDCLYLNVYTPNPKAIRLKPVIVFIHGGAWMYDSSSVREIGPDYIMQKDVVLVTFNFREGVFGFLSVSDQSINIPGNFGLKDQSFALRWVKQNIQYFGGDPNNILLFGYSSGSCAVHYHMLSNWSKGLFHKAMLMSGSVLNTRFILPEAKDFYVERLAALIGWNETGGLQSAVDILSTVNSSTLLRAQFQPDFLLYEDRMKGVRWPYDPVIERKCSGFISTNPRQQARNSWSKNIPVVLSSTSDEALLLRPAAASKGDTLLSSIDFTELIPNDIGRALSDNERENMAKRIRNFYFEDENGSQEQILNANVQMETDRLYVHGKPGLATKRRVGLVEQRRASKRRQYRKKALKWKGASGFARSPSMASPGLFENVGMYRTAISRLYENPCQNTYMYRFNIQSPTMNTYRILKCGQHCHGVSHGDDLSYIFRNFRVKSIDDIGEHEMKGVSTIVGILYNFAATNNPNLVGACTAWIPLNEQNRKNNAFKVLNIAPSLTFIGLPETDGMELWTSFYDADHLT